MSDFFNMGGYGLYVWTSYIFMAIIMISLLVNSAKQQKAAVAKVKRYLRQTDNKTIEVK